MLLKQCVHMLWCRDYTTAFQPIAVARDWQSQCSCAAVCIPSKDRDTPRIDRTATSLGLRTYTSQIAHRKICTEAWGIRVNAPYHANVSMFQNLQRVLGMHGRDTCRESVG